MYKMMKNVFVLIISVLPLLNAAAQDNNELLLGRWILVKSFDNLNNPIEDNTVPFFCLDFREKKNYIHSAPFNRGGKPSDYELRSNTIEIYPQNFGTSITPGMHVKPIIEYEILKMTSDTLFLNYTDALGRNKKLFFLKEVINTSTALDDSITVVDNKYLLLKDFSPLTKKAEYWPNNKTKVSTKQPTFEGDFGSYLIDRLVISKDFPHDTISPVVTVEFIVNEKGSPEGIYLINGLDEEFNKSLIKAISKTKNMWNPVFIEDKYIKVKTVYHILIYKSFASLFQT